MSTKSTGFKVKSTHKFINPSVSKETTVDDSNFIYELSESSGVQTKVIKSSDSSSSINKDTNVKTGSSKGMAIRTTVKSIEDYY